MGSHHETVNVNLNRGGNVIISKSVEPSRPRSCHWRPLYIPSASARERPEAWLPIPYDGFVSSSIKFGERMQTHKGVQNWRICLADMAKVNELVGASECRQATEALVSEPIAVFIRWKKIRKKREREENCIISFKLGECCQIYRLVWFQPLLIIPFRK